MKSPSLSRMADWSAATSRRWVTDCPAWRWLPTRNASTPPTTGQGWGQDVDRGKPGWTVENKISLVRFDLATGNVVDSPPALARPVILAAYAVGPGSPDKAPDRLALAGLALFKGRLYLGDSSRNEVLEIDPATGAAGGGFQLAGPVALAAGTDGLYAISGRRLVESIRPQKRSAVKLRHWKAIPSAWRQATMEGFTSVTLDRMWYTSSTGMEIVWARSERMAVLLRASIRWRQGPMTPCACRKSRRACPGAGRTSLGHGSGSLAAEAIHHVQIKDPDHVEGVLRADGLWGFQLRLRSRGFHAVDRPGALFKLDFAAKTARPISILGGEEGRTYRFWRQDGRTFVIACGKATSSGNSFRTTASSRWP